MASTIVKTATGLTGLRVVHEPAKHLRIIYARILKALDKMPATAHYRRSTEATVMSRLDVIDSEPCAEKLEQKFGIGQLEEVIQQAEYELSLTHTMLKHAPWEELQEKADPTQWKWPIS